MEVKICSVSFKDNPICYDNKPYGKIEILSKGSSSFNNEGGALKSFVAKRQFSHPPSK